MHIPELILDIGTNYCEVADREKTDDLTAALKMILWAKTVRATAVKFQCYRADKLARKDAPAYWDTDKSQYEVFKRQEKLSLSVYPKLKAYCDEVGIEFMATAFDEESLEAINPLVKRHKIASADITHAYLLEQVASYRKPVILSTGAASYSEICAALELLGDCPLTLMHCVLNYPTGWYEANLGRISKLKKRYRNAQIGYSDHCSYSKDILLAAWLLGAEIIEKHFTLSHVLKGNDHEHAMDIEQAIDFFTAMDVLSIAMEYPSDQTKARQLARRGVYLIKSVKSGQLMNRDDVEFLRPQNDGMNPMDFYECVRLAKRYTSDMKPGEQL